MANLPENSSQDVANHGATATHPSPRFSSDTKATHQTATHHSLSRPPTLSGEIGEEADSHIPGAFPDDSKGSRSLGKLATQGRIRPHFFSWNSETISPDKTHGNLENPSGKMF